MSVLWWSYRKSGVMNVKWYFYFYMIYFLTWVGIASCEWISGVSGTTRANGTMIVNVTSCVVSACSGARISASLVDACFVHCTLRTGYAFWTTSRRRSDISGQA